MEDFNEFYEFSFDYETGNNVYTDAWFFSDVASFIKVDEEEFYYLINRTGKEMARESIKKIFNLNVYPDEGVITLTGIYFLLFYSSNLKKYTYLSEYLQLIYHDVILELAKLVISKTPKIKRSKTSEQLMYAQLSDEEKEEFELKKYDSELKIPNFDIEDKSHYFYKKKIVISGNFRYFPFREDLATLIKSVGGDNNVSVSKKTDILIIGENPGPSKLLKAKEYNTTVLTEDMLLEYFPDHK